MMSNEDEKLQDLIKQRDEVAEKLKRVREECVDLGYGLMGRDAEYNFVITTLEKQKGVGYGEIKKAIFEGLLTPREMLSVFEASENMIHHLQVLRQMEITHENYEREHRSLEERVKQSSIAAHNPHNPMPGSQYGIYVPAYQLYIPKEEERQQAKPNEKPVDDGHWKWEDDFAHHRSTGFGEIVLIIFGFIILFIFFGLIFGK